MGAHSVRLRCGGTCKYGPPELSRYSGRGVASISVHPTHEGQLQLWCAPTDCPPCHVWLDEEHGPSIFVIPTYLGGGGLPVARTECRVSDNCQFAARHLQSPCSDCDPGSRLMSFERHLLSTVQPWHLGFLAVRQKFPSHCTKGTTPSGNWT